MGPQAQEDRDHDQGGDNDTFPKVVDIEFNIISVMTSYMNSCVTAYAATVEGSKIILLFYARKSD